MCGEEYYRTSLAALWTETFLYGFYTLLFSGFVYVMTVLRRGDRIWLSLGVILYILSSASNIVDFVTFLITPDTVANSVCAGGVCTSCNGQSETRTHELLVTYSMSAASTVLFITNQLVADSILTYYCYMIWQPKPWSTVLPAVMIFTTTIVGYVQAGYEARLVSINRDLLNGSAGPSGWQHVENVSENLQYATAGLSFATNVLITGLLVTYIFSPVHELQMGSGSVASRKYRRIGRVILETGVMYVLPLLVVLVLTKYKPGDYIMIVQNAVNQLVGIVPTTVMISVALRTGSKPSATNTTTSGGRHDVIRSPRSGTRTEMAFASFAVNSGAVTSVNFGEVDTGSEEERIHEGERVPTVKIQKLGD